MKGMERRMEITMRRFGAVLAALAVALAVTVCANVCAPAAWADDGDDYNRTVTFKDVATGDTVNAYKLISFTSDSKGYTFLESFKQYLASSDNPCQDGISSTMDDDALATWFQARSAEEVRLVLKGYMNKWGEGAGLYARPAVAKSASASATANPSISFEPGYYLVMPTTAADNSKLYNPLSVFVKADGASSVVTAAGAQDATRGDIEVTMKSEDGPAIEKYLKRANGDLRRTQTVQVGETVTYVVKLAFPGYDSMGNPEFVLHDAMSHAAYVEDSVAVYGAGADGSIDMSAAIDGAVGTVVAGAYADGSQELTFPLNYGKMGAAQGVQKTVYVVYQAIVESDILLAADGNGKYSGTNSAYLSYRTTADAAQSSQTNASSASIYTFSFDLSKLNAQGNALSGATFQLLDNAGDVVKFVQVGTGADAYYTPDPAGTLEVLSANCGANGNELDVRGIDASKVYLVREVAAPAGYYGPNGDFKLELQTGKDGDEHTGNLAGVQTCFASSIADDAAAAAADNALIVSQAPDKATYKVQLKNSTTPSLPTTGGAGIVAMSVAGVVLMVAAGAFLVMRRKKR